MLSTPSPRRKSTGPVDAAGAGGRDLDLVTARLALVRSWLGEVLSDSPSLEITSASQDASARHYLRVRNGKDVYVVMDAPAQARGQESWLDVRTRLENVGLSVPALHASDLGRGLLLISDLGFRHYLEELAPSRADVLYADAISALVTMQSRISCNGLPVYDAPFLRRELDLFDAWLLRRHLEVDLSRGQRSALEKCFEVIIAACLEQEQVFVHRDYHSRNLMVLSRGNPGILDFQDAVRGPIGYDVASLFRDVYVSWPEERVAGWVSGTYGSLRDAGLLSGVEVRRFQAMGRFLRRPASPEDCGSLLAALSPRRQAALSPRNPPDASLSARSERAVPCSGCDCGADRRTGSSGPSRGTQRSSVGWTR